MSKNNTTEIHKKKIIELIQLYTATALTMLSQRTTIKTQIGRGALSQSQLLIYLFYQGILCSHGAYF